MYARFSLLAPAFLLFGAACSSASSSATRPEAGTPAQASPVAAAPASAAPVASGAAPDCAHPFGLTSSSELLYALTDANGKALGELRQRVVGFGEETNKKGTVKTTTVLLKSGRYDADGKLLHQQDLTFRCRQDTAFTDGTAELEFDNLRSFRDRYFTDAPTPIAWPHQPAAGTRLPTGGIVTEVRSSAVDIAKVYTRVQNRRVVGAQETITVPAGSFACYKVESEREAAVQPKPDIVRRTTQRVVDFYNPSVGLIRTEVYDKNNKLQSTSVLARRTL
ncbi:hypothetical protein FY528_13760 [Hymenobacter lutimineralis]|uniref:DUF3108 domain-containing protein n=1 Tax=Hymenobacter lutimineralis TaxID=2606448 RepID=A0A5D6UYM1_9BACT|nr:MULTISPECIES: hypothetical protein [Hymenobacter]QIX63312.1 hypothetical protein HER32_19895 [Hymenobacter sp. BT18]TYZ08105.1 hypothetical protein FY528_13760 [Hymenobacter lutimineralis]